MVAHPLKGVPGAGTTARLERRPGGGMAGRVGRLSVLVGLQKTEMAKSMISRCGRVGSRRPDMPTGPGQRLGGYSHHPVTS